MDNNNNNNNNNKKMKSKATYTDIVMSVGVGLQPLKYNKSLILDGDYHCWLVNRDGNIIDPTPPAMKGKRYYKEWSVDEQRDAWKHVQKKIQHKYKTSKIDYYKNPQHRECPYNVVAYYKKHKKEVIIKIGSMGFQRHDGKVFWEFG